MKLRRTHGMVALLVLMVMFFQRGAWSQQHVMVQMSSDGSLIIWEKGGSQAPVGTGSQQGIDLMSSNLKVQIVRGTETSGWPQVIRGRGPRRLSAGLPAPSAPPPVLPIGIPDTPIDSLIDKSAQEHGLDPTLIRLVVQKESGFNPQAVSPKGAMGLMQLMPGTAALLGVQDPFNPAQNIDGGVRYLKQCLERFNYDVGLALAAYNAGPENVAKYQGVPPFAETRNYVSNILQAYTGQPGDIPPAPPALPLARGAQGNRPAAKRAAFFQTDLQPLVLPGGMRVQVLQSGRSKVIEVVSQ